MQIRHASGDDWWGGLASKRRDLLAAVERPTMPILTSSDHIGQVAEVVEWDGVSHTSWIVVRGNTEKLPATGNLIFGHRLAGRIIERRVEPGVIRGERGNTPGKILFRVSSEYCPPEGARVRLG
jgi:hypothetical protein